MRLSIVALIGVLVVPVSVRAQETVEYYGLDALGSVRVIFDAQGGVVSRMDYGPFGENLREAIKFPTEQFAQLARDAESGQDYAQARNYSAGTGRFNRVDPVYAGLVEPQRWNRYSYAWNSPLFYTDKTGLNPACEHLEKVTDAGISVELRCPLVPLGTGGSGGIPHIDPNPRREGSIGPPGRRSDKSNDTTGNNETSGVTLVAGADVNLVAGTGLDVNAGLAVGSNGCPSGGIAAGGFAGVGPAAGFNLGASLFVGVLLGPTRLVSGEMINLNVTAGGVVTVTVMFDTKLQPAGFTVGAGVGPPAPAMVSLSGTRTGTAMVGECR